MKSKGTKISKVEHQNSEIQWQGCCRYTMATGCEEDNEMRSEWQTHNEHE
jgi:hypothetical protein